MFQDDFAVLGDDGPVLGAWDVCSTGIICNHLHQHNEAELWAPGLISARGLESDGESKNATLSSSVAGPVMDLMDSRSKSPFG